jgi:hypothetical protein
MSSRRSLLPVCGVKEISLRDEGAGGSIVLYMTNMDQLILISS